MQLSQRTANIIFWTYLACCLILIVIGTIQGP